MDRPTSWVLDTTHPLSCLSEVDRVRKTGWHTTLVLGVLGNVCTYLQRQITNSEIRDSVNCVHPRDRS